MSVKRLAVPAVLAAGFCAAAPALAQTTLTLSSWVPPQHLLTRAMVDWAKEIEKATNGRVKHNLVPKAVASPPGTFDAVRDGLADVSFTVDGYTPGRFVLTRVAEFPQLGDSSKVVSVGYQRIHERHLAKFDEHKGTRVLAVFTHGPGQIYNTKRPIKAVADLEGLKIRVGGGMVNDVAKALGANALLKPAPESYEIISTGVADGLFFPAESIVSFKLVDLIKHVTLVPGGLYNVSFAFMMNPATYNKLSADDKKAVDAFSGERLARHLAKYWDEGDRVGVEAMTKANIPTIKADAAFLAALQAKVKPLEDAWFKQAAEKGLDGPKALAELRAEIKKVQ
ncbi:MAG: TRAP transporter substrate-binding protein [Burkholderiales bacterium]|nr:TRAP transporter substrate-binding protein [Burkholderiales bacterium]